MVMATGGRKKSEGKLEDAAAAFWRERDTRSRGKKLARGWWDHRKNSSVSPNFVFSNELWKLLEMNIFFVCHNLLESCQKSRFVKQIIPNCWSCFNTDGTFLGSF
jgi:hypothetical protein